MFSSGYIFPPLRDLNRHRKLVAEILYPNFQGFAVLFEIARNQEIFLSWKHLNFYNSITIKKRGEGRGRGGRGSNYVYTLNKEAITLNFKSQVPEL